MYFAYIVGGLTLLSVLVIAVVRVSRTHRKVTDKMEELEEELNNIRFRQQGEFTNKSSRPDLK